MEFLIARVGVSKPEINLQWRKFTHQLAVHRTCSFCFSFHSDSKFSERKILILINAVKSWPVSVEKGGLYFHEPAGDILPIFYPTDEGPNCFHLLLEQSLNHQCCYQHRTLEKFTFSFVDLLLGAEHICSFKEKRNFKLFCYNT